MHSEFLQTECPLVLQCSPASSVIAIDMPDIWSQQMAQELRRATSKMASHKQALALRVGAVPAPALRTAYHQSGKLYTMCTMGGKALSQFWLLSAKNEGFRQFPQVPFPPPVPSPAYYPPQARGTLSFRACAQLYFPVVARRTAQSHRWRSL